MALNDKRSQCNALADFLAAARRLEECWTEKLDNGYPAELPSFDEFVTHVAAWYEEVVDTL